MRLWAMMQYHFSFEILARAQNVECLYRNCDTTYAHIKHKLYTGRGNICRAGVYFLFLDIKGVIKGGMHAKY